MCVDRPIVGCLGATFSFLLLLWESKRARQHIDTTAIILYHTLHAGNPPCCIAHNMHTYTQDMIHRLCYTWYHCTAPMKR
ncbi:unnamed protein product [Pylaiella littoralis]